MADYYELLGVARSASPDELKRAYRQQARELHPDANPDDSAAAERFKEVSRAYQVLSDPDQRARYDRFGEAGVGSSNGGPNADDIFSGGLNDLFSSLFGEHRGLRRRSAWPEPARRVARTWRSSARITFEQAVFGSTVPVTLKLPQRCPDCDGSGRRRRHAAGDVRRVQRHAARCSGCARACSARWSPRRPARAAAASARWW